MWLQHLPQCQAHFPTQKTKAKKEKKRTQVPKATFSGPVFPSDGRQKPNETLCILNFLHYFLWPSPKVGTTE